MCDEHHAIIIDSGPSRYVLRARSACRDPRDAEDGVHLLEPSRARELIARWLRGPRGPGIRRQLATLLRLEVTRARPNLDRELLEAFARPRPRISIYAASVPDRTRPAEPLTERPLAANFELERRRVPEPNPSTRPPPRPASTPLRSPTSVPTPRPAKPERPEGWPVPGSSAEEGAAPRPKPTTPERPEEDGAAPRPKPAEPERPEEDGAAPRPKPAEPERPEGGPVPGSTAEAEAAPRPKPTTPERPQDDPVPPQTTPTSTPERDPAGDSTSRPGADE